MPEIGEMRKETELGFMRRYRWHFLAQTTDGDVYFDGYRLVWWRRLYLWSFLTLWIILGKEDW